MKKGARAPIPLLAGEGGLDGRADSSRALGERDLVALWGAGLGGRYPLADGRLLAVVFPGIPGRGAGPDFRAAVLEIAGNTVVGDIEMHARESGWRAHGHQRDRRYDGVALHVVGHNDRRATVTASRSGRRVPILVLESGLETCPFTPPCTGAAEAHRAAVLSRLGEERLHRKASRLSLLARARGPAEALYFALLETLGGPRNRLSFAQIARRLPLAAILERAADIGDAAVRRRVLAAELRWAAAGCTLTRSGQRPMASPERRLRLAAALVAALWGPGGGKPAFPGCLLGPRPALPGVEGLGRRIRSELLVNAVLPVSLLAGAPPEQVREAYGRVPTPGTYGRLKALERWLGGGGRAFPTARQLQGGLLLRDRFCARGQCGLCPLSVDRLRSRDLFGNTSLAGAEYTRGADDDGDRGLPQPDRL